MVTKRELADMLTPGFFQALHFWQDYKKYSEKGMFVTDYRGLTVQQKKVIDIFDDCLALKVKDDAAQDAARAEAMKNAPKLGSFK